MIYNTFMYILFDIGGTKMRFASSVDGESFGEPIIEKTPKDFDDGCDLIEKIVKDISGGKKIKAAAGGVAGLFNTERTELLESPNLTGWTGKPLLDVLKKRIGAPVYIENDTTIVGLGEAMHGAGKGTSIVVYMTVSTGVGGTRIVDGEVDEKALGFEPGRLVIDADNTLCPDCPGNTLESYVSGTAVEKRFGKKAYEIEDEKVWDELAKFLAYGLHNMIVHWSPDVVVLGGSMIVGEPAISIEKTKKYLSEIAVSYPTLPKIKKAELADVGGLYGAMVYLKKNVVCRV